MAFNYPGPYEVEIEYTTPISGVTLPHSLKVNCAAIGTPAPGSPASAISLQTRSGTPALIQTCVDGLWAFLRPMLHTSVVAAVWTLWRYPVAGSFAKDFITSGTLTNPAGTAAAVPTAAFYGIFKFRSAGGGTMGITLLESVHSQKTKIPLTANVSGNDNQKLAAYVISTAGWMIARDDSFPIVPTTLSQGENERLFRQRFR